MSGRPELIRFWIVMSSANITIPIVIIWSTHTGDLNRLGAVWSCWVCFIGLNALWLLALRSADRRVGRPGSGKRIIQAIALAFVAALLTTGYLNSYAPRNTYCFGNVQQTAQFHPAHSAENRRKVYPGTSGRKQGVR